MGVFHLELGARCKALRREAGSLFQGMAKGTKVCKPRHKNPSNTMLLNDLRQNIFAFDGPEIA